MTPDVWLKNATEQLTAEGLSKRINDEPLKVIGFWEHRKATERYVILTIRNGTGVKEWYIPYVYRRTNTFIDEANELAEYIKSIKQFLTPDNIASFKHHWTDQLDKLFGERAAVTRPIFKTLLENCGTWVWNKKFDSPNPQRRIQDLKEKGFTLATKIADKNTYHMLLPFNMVKAPTYEQIPTKVRKMIFQVLKNHDAYRGKTVDNSALPDHKFPEIRWTSETPVANDDLTPKAIQKKFQLVQESVNQTKREVCRACFQTGLRGKFAGIDFFYVGDEKWPSTVPPTGNEAEKGCVGCFWYDMVTWRKALNIFIRKHKR